MTRRRRIAVHVMFGAVLGLVAAAGVGNALDGNYAAVIAGAPAAVLAATAWAAEARNHRLVDDVEELHTELTALVPTHSSVVFVGGPLDGAELPLPPCPCGRGHQPAGVALTSGVYTPDGVARTAYRMKHQMGETS